MIIAAGTRLGPYEIRATIGAGGMGEVYEARDTRLDRKVAVKVLHPEFGSSPDWKQRFEREARLVASLNHPHICVLHDIGRQDDREYLVMELLDGQTLAARLQKGPLPLAEALKIAIEIADALEKAHRQGIVHRDLKPANVMLTKSGVKLLDFGLAKMSPAMVSRDNASILETAADVTARGTISGTLQYMAPEQIEGKDVDARADIWSFGLVLYEMVSGHKAFEASSHASLIAAIMDRQPAALDPGAAPVERITSACLEKSPDDRFQTMTDLRRELTWVQSRGPIRAANTGSPAIASRNALFFVLLFLFAIAGTVWVTMSFKSKPPEPSPVHFNLSLPRGLTALESTISPDGAQVVSRSSGVSSISIRRMNSLNFLPLKETSGARYLFWSPDSRSIGFFAGGKLKTIDIVGQSIQVLADAPAGRGGTWGEDGTILFSPSLESSIYRVSSKGGAATPATTLDANLKEAGHSWPYLLPDGKHFLYSARLSGEATFGRLDQSVRVGSLDGGPPKTLLDARSGAVYDPAGYLLFINERPGEPTSLVSQPFDPSQLALRGNPTTVATDVDYEWQTGASLVAVSVNGALTYKTRAYKETQLTWFDRNGRTVGTLGDKGAFFDPSLSRDGKTVAVERTDPNVGSGDVWTVEIERKSFSRLTSDKAFENVAMWSPDGRQLAFSSDREKHAIYTRSVQDGRGERRVFQSDFMTFATDWSRDGRFLLFNAFTPRTDSDLWLYSFDDDKATLLVQTAFREGWGKFSPDSRWIAYVTNESDRSQIVVRSFPDNKVMRQVSAEGGIEPDWRADGRELFYIAPEGAVMSVTIDSSPTDIKIGLPQPLFKLEVDELTSLRNHYTVSPDGQRFLINHSVADIGNSTLVVILNWSSTR